MSTFDLHPEAYSDLSEIWEFIAKDSVDAADRVVSEVYKAIQALVDFRNKATGVPIYPPGHYASQLCETS